MLTQTNERKKGLVGKTFPDKTTSHWQVHIGLKLDLHSVDIKKILKGKKIYIYLKNCIAF